MKNETIRINTPRGKPRLPEEARKRLRTGAAHKNKKRHDCKRAQQ